MSDASLSFTEGPLFRRLLAFALPLMAVSLLQYVYQAVDMVVVGQVVGPVGLVSCSKGANGACIVSGFVSGLAAGEGVVVARCVGAREVAGQRRAYAATLAVALAGSAAIAVLGVALARPAFTANAVPAASLEGAVGYTVVLCCGCAGPFLMNAAAAFLKAQGDARTPLQLVGVSALVNVALDLVLVGPAGLGAVGAARATVVAPSAAAVRAPAVVRAAGALALLRRLFTSIQWGDSVQRAVNVLVVSCPCALVISVPLSVFGGIGGASKNGILVKGGNYLEVLAKTELVVFDKTGTLTRGVFNVTAIHPDHCGEAQLLELAALAESYSDHPISRSLKEAYGKELDASRVSNVEELSGRGVRATVDGRQICAGNDKLMEDIGVSWHPCHRVGTTVHVASDGVYLGHIVISDEVKPDAKEAITALKACGVRRTVMLTGDAKAVGESVAQELGLDEVHTQLLPADKVTRVEALLGEVSPKGALAFVGDGINDAPVLSRADIGIAMGGLGSDAAIEAADIVLMDDKPSKLADAIRIARRTLAIVRQNIVFALAVKFLVLALSAAGVANMWEAVFADVGVSVIAILNAMRALKTVK